MAASQHPDEELLRLLAENTSEFIRLFDPAGKLVYANATVKHLLGEIPDDFPGFPHPEDRERSLRWFERVLAGKKESLQWRVRAQDGEWRWMETEGTVFQYHGRPHVLTICRDITERRQAEGALRESADRLQTLSRQLLEVQEAERRHLARELHDEVGQMLTGLRFLLKPNAHSSPDAIHTAFEQARGVVDELLERVRGLSFDLRPAALDQLGLVPALLAHFERYTKQTGVQVGFSHSGVEKRFAPAVETTAYRMVQEALTNVARHARVTVVAVRVWADADVLEVQVEDEGVGFDPAAVLAAGRSGGLAGMYERVRLLGGHLDVEAAPGSGAHVLAVLPLRGDDRRPEP